MPKFQEIHLNLEPKNKRRNQRDDEHFKQIAYMHENWSNETKRRRGESAECNGSFKAYQLAVENIACFAVQCWQAALRTPNISSQKKESSGFMDFKALQ